MKTAWSSEDFFLKRQKNIVCTVYDGRRAPGSGGGDTTVGRERVIDGTKGWEEMRTQKGLSWEGGEENFQLVRGKELSMKDEQREGRIIKEEKRKDVTHITAITFSVNLGRANSSWFQTSSSIYVSQDPEWRKSPPTQPA